jgi:hypothetical protein
MRWPALRFFVLFLSPMVAYNVLLVGVGLPGVVGELVAGLVLTFAGLSFLPLVCPDYTGRTGIFEL